MEDRVERPGLEMVAIRCRIRDLDFRARQHRQSDAGPGKFFMLLAVDMNNDRHGLVMMGTGPSDGFDRHQQGIYDATHRLRAW